MTLYEFYPRSDLIVLGPLWLPVCYRRVFSAGTDLQFHALPPVNQMIVTYPYDAVFGPRAYIPVLGPLTHVATRPQRHSHIPPS